MVKWRTAALAAALVLGVAATSAQARPLDDVVEAGVVRIVVYRDFAPFSGGSDNALVGVDVDLAGEIARHLGVDLHLMPMTADETVDDDLRNAVWLGPRITNDEVRVPGDIMLHVPYDNRLKQSASILDPRNEMIVLFAPYYREQLVVARRDATPTLDAIDDGERLGVEVDTMADFMLSGALGGRHRETTRRFTSLTLAGEALQRGELDGLMGPRSEMEMVLRDWRDDWTLSTPAVPMIGATSWRLGIAVREDSRDLGYAVDGLFEQMMADGRMAQTFARHGLTYTPPY